MGISFVSVSVVTVSAGGAMVSGVSKIYVSASGGMIGAGDSSFANTSKKDRSAYITLFIFNN